MRTLAMTLAAIVLSAGCGLAAAQVNPSRDNPDRPPSAPDATTPQTTGRDDARMQAPIGHRQPTARDVPPQSERNLGTRSREDEDLDRKMQICRGC